jgi:hypothetical protein
MSRQDRRRFEKEYKKLPKGDNCIICRKPFPHNSRTFGGLMSDGTTVLAGECCSGRLATVMVTGLYLTRSVDLLTAFSKPSTKKVSPGPVDTGQALTYMQSFFSEIDERTDALMRQAGVAKDLKGVFLGEHPWKANDAAWFKNYPGRSHRLRPLLEGEAEAMPMGVPTDQLPPNHRIEMLVRQVEPGKRIRKAFCRNTEIDVPDREEIIHAIFDIVATAAGGSIIDLGEIIKRAQQYADSRGQQLN